jgi:hypothetical protein
MFDFSLPPTIAVLPIEGYDFSTLSAPIGHLVSSLHHIDTQANLSPSNSPSAPKPATLQVYNSPGENPTPPKPTN